MFRKISVLPCVALGLIVLAAFFGADPVNAQILTSFGEYTYAGSRLTGAESRIFPQNNLTFWNPYECDPKGGSGPGPGVRSDSCFKINSSVGAQDFWYAEGCIDNGTCTAGIYFEGSEETLTLVINNKSVLWDSGKGRFRDDVIKTDDDFGGLQYIYAENYDFEYGGSETKLTPNGGSSTRKYYWVALPDEAYTKGFGDTYVATFENLSEPVYFITFDAHACGDQSEGYCDKALADPDGVEIGGEFLGALSKNGGSPTEAANKAGKLTSFCRINGTGEVLVTSNGDASSITAAGGSTPSSSDASSTPSSDTSSTPAATPSSDASGASDSSDSGQAIADKARELAHTNKEQAKTKPTEAFKQAAEAAGLSADNDCLRFVQVVVKASGVDDDFITGDYSHSGGVDEWKTVEYMNGSDKWTKIDTTDESSLQPGDIIVSAVNGTGNNHIFIYLGGSEVAAANQGEYYGRIETLSDEWSHFGSANTPFKYGGNDYQVFRLADGDCGPLGSDEYPQYFQAGQSWSGVSYDGGNIGDSGCGPSSMAMIASAVTGQEIHPDDIVDVTSPGCYVYTSGSGMTDLDKKVGEKYGFEVVNVDYSSADDAIAKMKQYLSDGYMLHFSGAGSAPFTSGGHYVGAFGIDGDTVHVADSNLGNADYNVNDLVHAGLHGGAFSASKGGSRACASKGNDDNICPDEFGDDDSDGGSGGGTVTAGGLDDDAAKALAAYYKSGGGTQCGGAQRESCYAFSMWFLCNFTSVVSEGTNACSGVATGGEVVGCLKDRYGISTGNEPKPFAIFSVPNHTGVVVRVNDDGSYVTVEAAENDGVSYTGWADTPGDGWARVFTHDSSYGASFAYVGDKVDMEKLNSVVGR